jgi:L-rhamnonate dehydratase
MDLLNIKPEWHIQRIEWCRLQGERNRAAGCNARLGNHGRTVSLDLVRITIAGETGFGWSRISRDQAEAILGTTVSDLFTAGGSVRPQYYGIEFPLLDWLGGIMGKPVYELVSGKNVQAGKQSFKVPCYDTSLYFDDLHLERDEDAVQFMQNEALQGWEQGHRSFKIKVGRGAMHMSLVKGLKRDIAIIQGIREAVGPEAHVMIDANNGYNLNLTKEVLYATSNANIYWIEEPFHEDPELFKDLKKWAGEQKLQVMIADGEGLAAPSIVDWAKQGLVDVIQYDIQDYGFHQWLELGDILDRANVRTAPHNYGSPYGNYASCHLASAIKGFLFVEWDEVKVPGLDTSAYTIHNGEIEVPETPGFGLKLDESYFSRLVQTEGWSIKV